LGLGTLYEDLSRVRIWVIAPYPRGVQPQNVVFGYDIGQISTGYLVVALD